MYGVLIKAAHKSLVWYRADAFEEAGVQPPTTWDELVTAAQTMSAWSGVGTQTSTTSTSALAMSAYALS